MRIYDGKSPIRWAYDGELTADDMRERGGKYELLLSSTSVLYDTDDGIVYSFTPLSALRLRWGVPDEGQPEEQLDAIRTAMQTPKIEITNEETMTALAELGALSSAMLDGLAELGTLVSDMKGGNNG